MLKVLIDMADAVFTADALYSIVIARLGSPIAGGRYIFTVKAQPAETPQVMKDLPREQVPLP